MTAKPVNSSAPSDLELGKRLRMTRKRLGLRLQSVADAAGVSVSLLSQIERGISSPSMRMLRNICHTLKIDGAELFEPSPGDRPASSPQEESNEYVVRAALQHPVIVGGIRKFRLTPSSCSQLEGFLINISGDAVSDPNFLLQTADKIGYVLHGRLRLFVDDVELMLEAGDAYGFPSGHQYRWENGWQSETSILVINSKHFYV